jgi:hypothetical protein
MSDNKNDRGKQDRTRINMNEDYEIQYWTKKWNISPQQLRGAGRATGSSAVSKIEKYLKEKGAI